MRARRWGWAVLLTVVASTARADKFDDRMRDAVDATAAGDHARAAKAFAAAQELAADRSATDRGRAAFGYALALDRLDRGKEAIAAYQTVLELGADPTARVGTEYEQACNNLGVRYLRAEKWDDAVATFRRVPNPAGPEAFVFHANYARALEKQAATAGKPAPPDVYKEYWKSVRLRPSYARSVDAVAQILLAEPTPRLEEARRLIEALTQPEAPQPTLAKKHLEEFVKKWGNRDRADDLRAAVVRHLAVAATPATYRDADRAWLQKLNRSVTDAALPVLDRLLTDRKFAAGHGEGDVRLLCQDPADARAALPEWKDWLAAAGLAARDVGALLARAGEWYAREADTKRDPEANARAALARLTAAFVLDPSSAAPALGAADLLGRHVGGLDPDPKGPLFTRYLDILYDGKTERLRQALMAKQPRKEDWLQVYEFRIVLGELFAGRKEWGSPSDYRSAIGQLTLALETEREIRRLDPTFPESPILARDLAGACRAAKDDRGAGEAYKLAAARFVQTGNPDRAEQAIAAARALPTVPPDLTKELDTLAALAKVTVETSTTAPIGSVSYTAGHTVLDLVGSDVKPLDLIGAGASGPFKFSRGSKITLVASADTGKVTACKVGADVLVPGAEGEKWEKLVRPGQREVGYLSVSKDGSTLAVSEKDGGVWVHKLKKPTLEPVPIASDQRVAAVALSGEGLWTATVVGSDVTIWDAAGKRTEVFRTGAGGGPAAKAHAVPAFSPDGKRIAAGGPDGQLWCWSVPEGKELFRRSAGATAVSAVAFSSNGRFLASGTAAGELRLWDATSGREIGPLPSARGRVESMAFSDGSPKRFGGPRNALLVEVRLDENRTETRTFDLSPLR